MKTSKSKNPLTACAAPGASDYVGQIRVGLPIAGSKPYAPSGVRREIEPGLLDGDDQAKLAAEAARRRKQELQTADALWRVRSALSHLEAQVPLLARHRQRGNFEMDLEQIGDDASLLQDYLTTLRWAVGEAQKQRGHLAS